MCPGMCLSFAAPALLAQMHKQTQCTQPHPDQPRFQLHLLTVAALSLTVSRCFQSWPEIVSSVLQQRNPLPAW